MHGLFLSKFFFQFSPKQKSSFQTEILEELRRSRISDLATLIQKTFRGYLTRQKWTKLKDSQVVISNFWKRWKDKSNVIEIKQRRMEEEAAVIVQRFYRQRLVRL